MMNMRLRYFVVKREPTTYCGLNLVDTPDVDIFAAPVLPVPPPLPSRFASAIQVLLCCGQYGTQALIFGVLMLFGLKIGADGQPPLTFFAALTLADTALVTFMMYVFLKSSGESFRQVFFGGQRLKQEIKLGLALIPVVLIGAGIMIQAIRFVLPGLHNVKISPFDEYFSTPLRGTVFLIVVIIAGGVREELQRGFLLHRFDQRLGGIWVGQIIFTLFFGFMHAMQGWDAAILTGSLGFLWGYLYIKRRSVAAAMISHAGFNGLQVLGQILIKVMGIPVPR
jgi:membrane protease YdiL (CAAX protease family)